MVKWRFPVLAPSQRQSFIISFTAFLAGILLLAMISILILIIVRGAAYFWPEPIYQVRYLNNEDQQHSVFAQMHMRYDNDEQQVWWMRYSDLDVPFGKQILVDAQRVKNRAVSQSAVEITLTDGRTVLAVPMSLSNDKGKVQSLEALGQQREDVENITRQIDDIRIKWLSGIHEKLAELDVRGVAYDAPARLRLNEAFTNWQSQISALEQRRDRYVMQVAFSDKSLFTIKLFDIAGLTYVGKLSGFDKFITSLSRIGDFLTESPKQANTAGGVFPALFGTILMVLTMTLIVTPFGVMAAVYLCEYAPNNTLTSIIRISVSNMAGVPSIVYGVFGLGFFVYFLGGNLDTLFFTERLPAPTMGTPGLFWASLTMAILTLPVVIVATEEGLRRVPEGLKAGSYALGATKAETMLHTVLPIASPGIMTGVILAIARAAGEVAPLMLVGAVKFAPNLPIDNEFPYLHLDRQFMHLGVLIYDGAFHSQTDPKGSSMMFAACLLLLIVVFVLNILAVMLRTRLRRRYLQG